MRKPHKHAELIKAWADGAEIEMHLVSGKWVGYEDRECPTWNEMYEYRIRPEPRPDVIFYGRIMIPYIDSTGKIDIPARIEGFGMRQGVFDNFKFVFDGETGKLKSAEVI